MGNTDSNVTARLTVDILSFLKTCPSPLFPLFCEGCQTIVGGMAPRGLGGGVRRDSRFHSVLIVRFCGCWGE